MSRCRTTRRGGITIERRLMRQRTGNSFGRFGHRHEQSERTARKWRESKVAIEGRCRFIRRFDHDGEYRERTGGNNYPTNCVGKQKIADTFAANFLIARETPNEGRWNEVIAWQTFCIFGRQVGDSECEGTQAVETDDPTFIVDGDKNARHITFLVLSSAKVKPIIERGDTARKCRAVILTERYDRFDHPQSAEEMSMTLQSLDQTRGRIGCPANRRKEGVAIRTRQDHTLMLVEKPARTLIGEIVLLEHTSWPHTYHPAVGSCAKFGRPMCCLFWSPSSSPLSLISLIGSQFSARALCRPKMTTLNNAILVRSLSTRAGICAGHSCSTIARGTCGMEVTPNAMKPLASLPLKLRPKKYACAMSAKHFAIKGID